MAENKTSKAPAKKQAAPKPQPESVDPKEFKALTDTVNTLASGMSDMLDLIKSGALSKPPQTVAEILTEKEADKATANKYTVNPDWEDIAREIIGAAVDHTEIEYVKGGGMKFTVVIKEEFSNASTEYLERHKVDRRSKEVGTEGEAGVRVWCEQIRNNLKRTKPIAS